MSSQSQPPIPPAGGLRGEPGSNDSASSPSAPSADSPDEPGVVTIQGTEVIDATGADTTAAGDDADVPTSGDGAPVEPIPPVSDPADDPVVAENER
ncbi:MAG: hypothetical protein IPL41_15745 [Micropruina sp.]|nr:hypothetical protein [Micropruina sp.]